MPTDMQLPPARKTQKTYLALKQPPLNPPAWVFGPVWTLLYGGMGFAAYRAWTAGAHSPNPRTYSLTRQGATLYTIQLGLNLIWMPLFFHFKRPIEATIDVVALTGITGYLTYLWSQVDEVAGYALVPYLGWLGFATYLCSGAGYLNGWSFAGLERPIPPGGKDTNFVSEKKDSSNIRNRGSSTGVCLGPAGLDLGGRLTWNGIENASSVLLSCCLMSAALVKLSVLRYSQRRNSRNNTPAKTIDNEMMLARIRPFLSLAFVRSYAAAPNTYHSSSPATPPRASPTAPPASAPAPADRSATAPAPCPSGSYPPAPRCRAPAS
ncbi:hypothetical protein FH972_023965 [Carpinus fangiana]|uniref:TspO/MBR-related protein n=1 Tax=Carpinus fangiana TaxID=176857 RepID=A0A5N6KX26_9ROSI|nr:hypothetical protein FH972_023965 [Carpinus fangiana]